jgi:hypothetical protein
MITLDDRPAPPAAAARAAAAYWMRRRRTLAGPVAVLGVAGSAVVSARAAVSRNCSMSRLNCGTGVGYFVVPTHGAGGLFISLVPDNAPLTGTSTPPAPPRHGSGPTR